METHVSLRGNNRFLTGIRSFLYEDTGVSLRGTEFDGIPSYYEG